MIKYCKDIGILMTRWLRRIYKFTQGELYAKVKFRDSGRNVFDMCFYRIRFEIVTSALEIQFVGMLYVFKEG